jgi:hypothetical protein
MLMLVVNLCCPTDALALYDEVGEASEDATKLYSNAAKLEKSARLQKRLLKNCAKVRERKDVLDATKKSEGSITSILGAITVSKRGKKRTRNPKTSSGSPDEYVNKRVAKWFDAELFFGTVKYISNPEEKDTWWHITYDDDDEEDFDIRQLRKALKVYAENCSTDPKNKRGNSS